MKVWAMTVRTASTLSDTRTSKMSCGFFRVFTQNLKSRLGTRASRGVSRLPQLASSAWSPALSCAGSWPASPCGGSREPRAKAAGPGLLSRPCRPRPGSVLSARGQQARHLLVFQMCKVSRSSMPCFSASSSRKSNRYLTAMGTGRFTLRMAWKASSTNFCSVP